jgi:hypothetical protein
MRVAIHEAVDKADGVVFRCTLSGSAADRWLAGCSTGRGASIRRG